MVDSALQGKIELVRGPSRFVQPNGSPYTVAMSDRRMAVVGGGAAGFFAAIACAEANPNVKVTLLEKGTHFLAKVRISGGGRCNVTHACFSPGEFVTRYPRGGKALLGAFHRFGAQETVEWFEARGVRLKAEQDGRMFPVTDSSQTVIDCLVQAARNCGVELVPNCAIEQVRRLADGNFELTSGTGKSVSCERALLGLGGCRAAAAGRLAVDLGHTLIPPVPSLFALEVSDLWLRSLAGISVPQIEVFIRGTRLRERGPAVITHTGMSGPAILRLSAWGARELHAAEYKFELGVNWLPHLTEENVRTELATRAAGNPARQIVNSPVSPLPQRLWEQVIISSGLPAKTRWAELSKAARHSLVQQLVACPLQVVGKSLNKDEFVTCGGVVLGEVDFKTMESRIVPGLYFAGELLDIDGVTGGFNFQAAWTTGWIAGRAMATA